MFKSFLKTAVDIGDDYKTDSESFFLFRKHSRSYDKYTVIQPFVRQASFMLAEPDIKLLDMVTFVDNLTTAYNKVNILKNGSITWARENELNAQLEALGQLVSMQPDMNLEVQKAMAKNNKNVKTEEKTPSNIVTE